MQQFFLLSLFLVFSQANSCKTWRRSLAFQDPEPIGSTLFLVQTSAMYICSMICSRSEICAIFTYDQPSGNCTGFRTFIFSRNALTIPGHVYYKVVQLTVTITTGTGNGAGIDSKVFLKLYGSFGETKAMELVDNTSGLLKFEQGDTDIFDMTSLDAGTLQRIQIGHDNSLDSGWLVETITISVNGQPDFTFEINGWLNASAPYMTIEAP